MGRLCGHFPDSGRLFFRIDCSVLTQLRDYCESRQPRLVGKADPVGVRQFFRILFPHFRADSPDGRRELFPLPMACLGVVVPGACGLHDGAERLRVSQEIFSARSRSGGCRQITTGKRKRPLRFQFHAFKEPPREGHYSE